MKILNTALICIVIPVLLSGCGSGSGGGGVEAAQPTEAVETVQPADELPRTLIIIGDSIMAGCFDSVDQPNADYSMTTAHLVAQRGVRVVNLSRGGNSMMTAVAQRVDGGVNFTQSNIGGTAIWITLGANDFIWGKTTTKEYRDNYLTVLSRINPLPKQKLFCVTPLISGFDYEHRLNPKGETYEEYRQVVRDIATEGHCNLVDTSLWFSSTDVFDECNMPDSVHLGEEGHKQYSEFLLETIRDDYSNL